MWPITQSSPTLVGWGSVVCTTVPSWIDVRAPIEIGASSARITAPAHTDDPAPSVSCPMSTASGCT